ncbi:YopT-type cysteine protease domain-containing protein [Pasteurella canis]|uniref:YopT-type cysteine protease domain-containing protein n=1 Tax=Pasteurella canis TaxID=753 RepID=UPI001CC3B0A7|nr:YopT-type cysteine protease domain-containing protein [Pasteurella canis]
MNKNRYKLIFSKSKSCLVPVAECIKSAMGNGSSDSVSESNDEAEEPPLSDHYALSPVSLSLKSALNPVSSVMQLTWKQFSILLLTVVSTSALADQRSEIRPELKELKGDNTDIQVATEHNHNNNGRTKLYQTENKVIVIDIATPNDKGISNNRFEKFNIPNGAVFNNNGTTSEAKSKLVGYIRYNKNIKEKKEADVILSQVTGTQESKIVGALEVLGKEADIVIANQNGINLNGVRAINSKRFVATTSKEIKLDQEQEQIILDVEKGKVTIDVNGFATDGLQYLDIIAKTIEQKQSITTEKDKTSDTEISFIAGKSKYDFKKREVTEKNGENVKEGTIAITGASTGAMHGKNIKLIVTDKGAGVKHDGIILSENDIHIELHDGDLEFGNTEQKKVGDLDRKVQAKKNIAVKGAKRTIIGSQVKAEKITVETQETKIRKETEVRAQEVKFNSKDSISLEKNSKLVATKVDVETESLENEGLIYGSDVKLDANDLVNKQTIFAEKKLDIKTKGKKMSIAEKDYVAVRFLESSASLKPGFVNKGVIESKEEATLTFKDQTSYLVEKGDKFVKAGKKLTIDAQNVELNQQDIQLSSNININVKESFINRNGTLATAQDLKITAENGSIYNIGGILGSAKSLGLNAKSSNGQGGNVVNQEGGLLHTLGDMSLDAAHTVYNLGNIFAHNKIKVEAHKLINDVRLSGKVTFQENQLNNLIQGYLGNSFKLSVNLSGRLYEMSQIAQHGWHNNVYKLNLNVQELDKADIKVEKMGMIRSDGDFEFKARQLASGDQKTEIINHGLINIKGTFKSDAEQITNQMKAFEGNALETVFRNPAKITFYYQPLARFFLTALSGNASREFNSLEGFLDALFSNQSILTSFNYSAENFNAYKILSHVQHSPMYQKAMAQVFGAEWHSLPYDQMKTRWQAFKDNPTNFNYYPAEKAKILAGTFDAKTGALHNGEHSQYGSFDGNIKIDTHQLTLPQVEFRPEFNSTESLDNGAIDLSSIAELLDIPNLFIDSSVQLDKEGLPPIEELNNSNNDSESDSSEEESRPDEERNNEESTPNRTDSTIDYLNPDEYLDNGYLLNQLLKELNEEPLIKDGEDHFNRRKNLKALYDKGEEKYPDNKNALLDKVEELYKQKQQEQKAKNKQLVEQQRANQEKQQAKRVEQDKQEEKRQQQDKVAKQAEIAKEVKQAEEIRAKEKVLAEEIKVKEEKHREEVRVAEEKQKAEKQKKAEEKAAHEKREVEAKQTFEQNAQYEADAAKNASLKVIDDNRPKVETDPLYRTKLKYINQDEYAGANYFFNKLGLDTQGTQKVNVLGDNYFDHQLITRAIEKKADNRLNQKYNLTDVELVKKLMENSTSQAKALDLKLGAGLTKEQQSKLTEDIVWYVKTNVNGKDVFVPQVYFAPETLAETKKLQGLGTGVISAGEVNIKAENVTNTGTIAGDKVKIEASNKIQNKGSILSTEETRLVGRKGIENLSRSFANDELGVTAQRSEIKTEGHLHLETDKDASVDVQASDIKAKSGFVKTGDVNLKDTYNTKHSYEETIQHAGLHTMTLESGGMSVPTVALASPESHSKQESQATSVGSKVDIGQLHLAVENDVNQVGSELKSNRISGIVKGNYNTEAGKNVKHVKREDYTSGLYGSAHASGGGTSVRYDYNSKEGGKAATNVPTSQTGAGVELGVSLTHEKESATLLTHTNSELQVESGKLHVLGHADIGGVDINTKIPEKAQDKAAPQDTAASNNDKAAPSNTAEANKPSSNEGPIFRTLSEEEIAELMSEKSKDYFEQQAKTAPEQGFELSAKEIKSTKQKDEYTLESTKTTFKIGAEAEAHSAVADLVSHIVKEYRDAQNGIKQDGTAALQYASDALNIVTGDLAGTSAKVAVERNHETKNAKETGDIVTKIGGNVTLSAHSGNVELRNVQSDKNTNLTLKAKEDINILAGEKTRQSNETVSRQKVATGVNAGCSMMSGACTAGTSSSIEGNESYTSENSLTHNNSLLQGQNIKLEAGRDLNLESSNIEANNVDLNIEGTTNIISKQDTLQKSTHGFDYNLSAGVALSSATIATPTGNIGAGYTNETETKRTVNQQAGIKANKLTGKTQNLNLEAGYIASNDKSRDFKVQGNVTTKELHDHHDKDGGSFGMSVGISERGTTAFNVRGGRADQKHYNATQKSTLSGVDTSKAQVSGSVNTNLANAKEVTRDDTYASTQFAFEVGDLAELGQRAKNKIKSSSLTGVPDLSTANTRVRNDVDAPQTRARSVETDVDVSTPKSRLLDNTSDSVTVKNPIYESADSLSSTPRRNSTDNDAVSVKNPIYESIESVGATPRARNTDSTEMVDNPLYSTVTPRTKATTEAESATAKAHVYEEIPLTANDTPRNKLNNDTHEYAEVGKGPYSTLGDINSDRVRNKVANTDDPTYAKVGPEGTYSKLGDSSSDITRNKSLANDAHEYAEVGKGPYSTLGDINSDRVRNKVANTDDPTYAKVGPEGTYSKLGDENASSSRVKSNNTTEGTYSTVGDGHSDIARRSTNTPEYAEVQPRTRRSATDKLPEIPTAKARVTTDAEGVYSEINTAGTRRQATDPLPELPQFAQPKAKTDSDSAEHIYEDISNLTNRSTRPLPTLPNAKVRTDSEAEYTTITTVPKTRSAKDALPDVPTGKAKVEVDNDGIYSQISDVATAQPRSKSAQVESDYETIPLFNNDSVAPKAAEPRSKRSLSEEITSTEPKVRSVSEEISDSVVNKTKSTTEEIYSTLDKSVEGRARANAKADEALATQNTVRHKARIEDETPPPLPKRPENLTAEAETQTSVNTTGKVTGPEALVSEQGKWRSRVTDGDYATVEDVVPTPRSKTDRPLPQTPEAQTQLRNRVKVEGDYAEVVDTVSTPRSKADRELPKLPNEAVAKSRLSSVEGDYAEIGNVTTPRLQQPKASVEPQSLLAEANTNNNSNRAKKVDIKDASTESPAAAAKAEKSWFSKVKDFFSGSSSKEQAKAKASKAAKVAEQDAQVAAKPRYDDLDDNINLKNLLALEDQRNGNFENNVLKNAKFLDEAREAAKKTIPEATIKQMGNSPEFDEILTDGARKVEKRINDAVTFKPSVEEFAEIQGLVKKLPKGEVIEDVNIKTQSITEALAETSKTIQRNPKLKEEVQGAIEEFLKSSQGKDLTVEMIEKLNHGLRPDEGSDRQLYKKETLTKENAVFSSPEASKIQLSETVDFINQAKRQGVEPSVVAGLVYQRLIAYHPFAEGNGRMARVIVNKLLLDGGYPPFTKFNSDFETQIIPQTLKSAKSATSAEVVKEFLTELSKKPLPEASGHAQSKAQRDLPDVPELQQGRKVVVGEGDYAEITETGQVVSPQVNAKGRTANEESVVGSAKVKTDEDLYATIDKSPEARAKARGDEAEAKNPKVVVSEAEEEFAPLLPIRPELKDAAGGNKKAKVKSEDNAGEKTEKASVFQRVKQFFTGSDSSQAKASKGAKATEQDAQVAAKPRYDDLDDNINLKNLLALEDQRNGNFENNVLKNAKFLDEAREAAKKTIPEATIKQMGNSPEFDEILTDGARKVEKRINDAVTFKPSVEEFAEIQGLVKKLPKGEVIEDVNIKTQSITEALAETSKTIQRNPKLKEEVQGAIEEFLKSSQGKDLTVEMIEKLNHGLRPDEGSDRQLYKKETLTKENAVFSSPEASKIQLSETVDFINQAKRQGVEPSVVAGLVYQRLIAYHPFAEGNGRMARVIVNKLLLDGGYPPFTKFNSDFETQIIPQTLKSAKSATSAEVVKEFLTELSKKPLPEASGHAQSKAQRDLPDVPELQQGRKVVVGEGDYAEITETGQVVSPQVNAKGRTANEESVVGSAKVKTDEDLYATIDKSPEARAKAKARSDEAAAKNVVVKKATVDSDVAPALPPRPSEFKSAVESTTASKAPAKEKPPVAPKPKVKVIVENDADGVAKTRVVVQPEVADAPQLKSRQVTNSDYAEIVDGVPQLQPRAKARQTAESDYEDIDTFANTQSTTKTRTTEEVAVPNKLKVDDGLYATVDKSPEALAKAKARGDEAAAAQAPTRKVQVEDELPPALPKRSADLTKDDHASTQGTAERQFRSLPVDVEATDVVSTPQATAKAKPVSERIQQKELVEQSRGVLKQVQDQFQPLKVKHKIDAVRSSVEEYGGEVTFKYAQSKGEVYKEIVKHLETQHGVCESTCAHWIAKKVDPQDDNFWTSLYEGGQKGHLKKEAIDSIKKLQTEFINSGSATQQFKLTDSWLQEQGVVPKEKKFGNLSRRDEVAGTVSKTDVSALSKAILDTGNETSAVKKISINLEGGSHTVSAAIQGQKVVFFDPNFGEMTFPTHQKFDKWLKEAFWDKSGYAGKNEGKRFFNVVNYELPAKASDSNVGKVKATTEANDGNFKARTSSNSEASSTESAIQIRKDAVSGESYVTKDNVVTAITNTQYIPKPVSDVDAQFEKVRQKAKSADSAKEAEKKLALIAKEAKNLPKEHLLKATDELVNGMSTEDRRALRQQEHKAGAVLPTNNVIKGFEGKNVKNMGKILKNVQFDEGYVETRKQINEKIVEKLDSNKEFHDLMKGKLSGNEEGIRKLFDIVETAKRESLKEVTGIEGTKAKLELNTKNGPLSMGQGHYANDEVHMNLTPIASFLRSKKRNNQEILDTILHELTHHDQAQITKNKYDANLPDNLKKDANLLALNENYYIDADVSNFGAYKQQPLEREAFSSGHSLSKELGKLVERGYQGKVQEIETIEHLPNKLNNLESPREAQASLGDNALIYGLQQGRKELIAKANAADAEGKNAILADSYIGKLNLGFEFAQLSSFAKQVKSGNVTEQDIQEIASFNEPTAKLARRDDSKNRINDANIEDNQRIIRELIKNENAVDALKRIATLTDQEQSMYDALRKNDKFDMEELQESSNYTTAENSAIREYKNTQNALNDARMDFFAEKTKFIAKETLERGGQLYFALDGLATDTMTFRANTKIDLNRLKEVFDPNNPHYDSVTSRELRYLYENYKDHPNLKFTIKDHVIENPFKTLEIPTTENTVSSSEQNTVYKKQLLPSLFKRKAKSDGPKIEHLGGSTEKDAFYFPLDKIVTKDRGISKDMKVNMENIKKAFNPRDKHYDSVEARNLRALYEQDPTMSSTRFVIGNQVIENPFKSPELQDYIKKHHVSSPVAEKTAKPLPALPKTESKEQTVQKVQQTAPKKPVQLPKPKAEKVVDPNAIYAQVNKNRKTAEVEGFYPESQLRTRSDKIVEQVSHVPTTEPTYADLQFSHKTNRVQSQSENEVIYDKVAAPVKGTSPKTTAKPQKPQKPLSKGIIPESQLKTRSDKIAEQVSRVPTTEPTYAELQFVNKLAAKHETPKDVVYEEVATKGKSKNAKPLTKPQKPKQQLNKGIIPESQLRTRSDKMAEQVSHVPTTEPVYADIQFPASSKTQRAVVSPQETIYEEVGKRAQEEPIYQNVIRQGVNNK